MFDLRSHTISRANATPKTPELKVKKGTAKSVAIIKSSITATSVWREMNSFAFSRNSAIREGPAVFAKG
jgi:hypothetical protein